MAPERRNDGETRDRIGHLQHVWELTAKYLTAMVVVLYVAAAFYGWYLWQLANDIDSVQQQGRVETVERICIDTNERHDKTITGLRAEVDRAIEERPQLQERLERSYRTNVRLIDIFLPKRTNCRAYASRLVPPP
jgi:hypothetical protein